jgi:hypothetical protein
MEWVAFSTHGIVKMMESPTYEYNISVFSRRCLDPEFVNPVGFKRDWDPIIRSIVKRLEATRQFNPRLLIQSNDVYAELWLALLHLAAVTPFRNDPASVIVLSPLTAAQRRRDNGGSPPRWYPSVNFLLSLLSFLLSSLEPPLHLMIFAPISLLWFLWSPETILEHLHAVIGLQFIGKSLRWTTSSAAMLHLATVPSIVSFVMGLKGVFWSLFYLMGWFLRYYNLDLLQPDSRTL